MWSWKLPGRNPGYLSFRGLECRLSQVGGSALVSEGSVRGPAVLRLLEVLPQQTLL